ncbi:MAG: T9SS type A sorting domain-containing protein [candidate division KSB1 bacterium]|nr:T9SS type A sorting domain-containing protein [candidate division KSB1 bacterium]
MQNGKMIIIFMLMVSASLFAQDVVVLEPSDGSAGTFLNEQIVADTTATGGLLPNRVYELQRGEVYLVNATLRMAQPGETLRLRAQDGDGPLPEVYMWETGTGDNPERPPGYFIRTQGGDLELTNIAISGYYEYEPEKLDNIQGGLLRNDVEGASFFLDGCIFKSVRGQVMRVNKNAVTVSVTNCIFADLGYLLTSNLGAGKGIDLRESEIVEFIMENNTFVNYQDRVVRHYNWGDPLEGTGLIHKGRINHNTIVNGMGYHGLLSLGNVGASMQITNNLFIDAFGLGEDSTDASRAAEWANTGEVYANGNNKITWIFSAPNDVTQWDISNNYFAISDSGQAFLDDFDFGPAPRLSDHIKGKLGAAAADAFTQIDIQLSDIPDMMTNLMRWYEDPNGGNKSKVTDNFDKTTDDMDRQTLVYYRDTFDCSYATGSAAYTGAENDYPAGDLNWFPDKKAEWESDITVSVKDSRSMPEQFILKNNYPNPFNPSTKISFNLPKSDMATLSVYNMLGQHVATLINERLDAGYHEFNFDASSLSNGVYFYKLVCGDFTSVKKMMLIK